MDGNQLIQLYSNLTSGAMIFKNDTYKYTNIGVEYTIRSSPDGSELWFNCVFRIMVGYMFRQEIEPISTKLFSVSTENIDVLREDLIANLVKQNCGTITDEEGNTIATLGDVLNFRVY